MAEIGAAFVHHYYTTFDANRENLVSLYADSSMMTFEGTQCLGAAAIVEKFKVRFPRFYSMLVQWLTQTVCSVAFL